MRKVHRKTIETISAAALASLCAGFVGLVVWAAAFPHGDVAAALIALFKASPF